jgi:hypothetical protein
MRGFGAGVVMLFGVSTTAVDVADCVFSVLIFYVSLTVVVLFCWPVAVVFRDGLFLLKRHVSVVD